MGHSKTYKFLHFISILIFATVLFGCNAPEFSASAPVVSADIVDIIARYRQVIPQAMQQNEISAVSIAVVDDRNILWQESFGYTDWSRKTPATPDTLFSIQSMTKSFTATAVMFAAQDGLVDLDTPITTYLPDFRVNSIFEDHPEQKMTLRILLSHTAGFPMEAPYGNNYTHPAYSFERHVASISDTWLRFPVGTRYSYSNLDIDLAGYILQVRSGLPFSQYVQQKVLEPLGMTGSTLDVARIRATANRAIGSAGTPIRVPVDFLFIPSGGMWTTASDMARYLQFHINKGAIDGKRLLPESLAETMYTPPNAAALNLGYALGLTVDTRNGARHFQHGGGGFGFTNTMAWYPELRLGVVVLTNAQDDSWCVELGEQVLDSIIQHAATLYTQRALAATRTASAYPPSVDEMILSDAGLQAIIASNTLLTDAAAIQRRAAYVGVYVWPALTVAPDVQVLDTNGQLFIQYQDETGRLTEVQPGLFFTPSGDTFDVRGTTPMLRNVALTKANPSELRFKVVFYALSGLVFLSTLLFWPVRAIVHRLRRKPGWAKTSASTTLPAGRLGWAGVLAGLGSLFSLFCLGLVALLPSLVFVPWPQPYPDLLWWQYAIFCLPFAGIFLGIVIALLVWLATRGHVWARTPRVTYLLAALALISFNLTLLI